MSSYVLRLTHLAVPQNASASASTPVIAPGAENVGQAQILDNYSKAFTLEGLFGVADAGAFGEDTEDIPMNADEDGDVFWDAVEGDSQPMDEDGFVTLLSYILPHS